MKRADEIDVILAGVSKCGTTTMIKYFNEHPELFVPWDESRDRDLKFHNLPSDLEIPEDTISVIRQEGFLYEKDDIKELYEINPDMKFVLIFRDPVKRANSAYWQKVRNRGIKISFEDSFTSDKWEDWVFRSGEYKRGLEYLEDFPDENKHYIIAEEWWKDEEKVLDELFDFLGVRKDIKFERVGNRNPGGAPRSWFIHDIVTNNYDIPILSKHFPEIFPIIRKASYLFNLKDYPEMDEKTRRYLIDHYSEVNEDLDEMIGKDLSKWWDWWE